MQHKVYRGPAPALRLYRALLHHSKLLLLDEATASVDNQTDQVRGEGWAQFRCRCGSCERVHTHTREETHAHTGGDSELERKS
jgi:ABC-type Mn2+/Zn2+ transport system ATPase subunit